MKTKLERLKKLSVGKSLHQKGWYISDILKQAFLNSELKLNRHVFYWNTEWEAAKALDDAIYKEELEKLSKDLAAPIDDPVHHPAHYTSHPCGLEIIDITKHHGFLTGNILKYVFRHKLKGQPIQDLKKARWYIDKAISELEKEQ